MGLKLSRLTKLEIAKIQSEEAEIEASVVNLTHILAHDSKVYEIMISDSMKIIDRYHTPRRSILLPEAEIVTELDTIPDEMWALFILVLFLVHLINCKLFDKLKMNNISNNHGATCMFSVIYIYRSVIAIEGNGLIKRYLQSDILMAIGDSPKAHKLKVESTERISRTIYASCNTRDNLLFITQGFGEKFY